MNYDKRSALLLEKMRGELDRKRQAEMDYYRTFWPDVDAWGPLGGEMAVIDIDALRILLYDTMSDDLWCNDTKAEIMDRARIHQAHWNQREQIEAKKRMEYERSIYILNGNQIPEEPPF